MGKVKAFECAWVARGKDKTPCKVISNNVQLPLRKPYLTSAGAWSQTVGDICSPFTCSKCPLAGFLRRFSLAAPVQPSKRQSDDAGRILAVRCGRNSSEFWVMRKVEHQFRMMESSPAWFGQELADRAEQKGILCTMDHALLYNQFLTQNQTWPLLALHACNPLCLR